MISALRASAARLDRLAAVVKPLDRRLALVVGAAATAATVPQVDYYTLTRSAQSDPRLLLYFILSSLGMVVLAGALPYWLLRVPVPATPPLWLLLAAAVWPVAWSLAAPGENVYSQPVAAVIIFVLGERYRSRWAVVPAILYLGLWMVMTYWFWAPAILLFWVGRASRRARLRQLDTTLKAERVDVAREVHDLLGHTLTALSVQLSTGRSLLTNDPVDPHGLAALDRAQQLAHDGLEETRRVVTTLRGEAQPLPETLALLASDFQKDSEVECRLTLSGDPRVVDAAVQLAMARAAREGLTNVRKHSIARTVEMTLRYGDGELILEILDDGPARTSAPAGYGLIGLRERVELVSGTLRAAPLNGGFKLELRIPSR